MKAASARALPQSTVAIIVNEMGVKYCIESGGGNVNDSQPNETDIDLDYRVPGPSSSRPLEQLSRLKTKEMQLSAN